MSPVILLPDPAGRLRFDVNRVQEAWKMQHFLRMPYFSSVITLQQFVAWVLIVPGGECNVDLYLV